MKGATRLIIATSVPAAAVGLALLVLLAALLAGVLVREVELARSPEKEPFHEERDR